MDDFKQDGEEHRVDSRLCRWTPWAPVRSELRELSAWKLTRLQNIVKEIYGEAPCDPLAVLTLKYIAQVKAERSNSRASNRNG